MGAWTAPLLVASALLAVAGAPKAVDPTNTVGALRSVGRRVPPLWVRIFGAAESALGVAALVSGAPAVTLLVALSYAGFSVFLLVALRSGGAVSSCGCLGRADTPPTRSHLAVTSSLALSCVIAAFSGAGGLASIGWSAASVATVAFAVLASWLVWLVFTALPNLSAKES
ncbi:MAG TPA: MauE/DoxX family redox-associated membrane protein [Mycobacteriales bacterium]|nr:MauE/DoxX family redox-associated membrane protein [Mycobacteriales bacterium]